MDNSIVAWASGGHSVSDDKCAGWQHFWGRCVAWLLVCHVRAAQVMCGWYVSRARACARACTITSAWREEHARACAITSASREKHARACAITSASREKHARAHATISLAREVRARELSHISWGLSQRATSRAEEA